MIPYNGKRFQWDWKHVSIVWKTVSGGAPCGPAAVVGCRREWEGRLVAVVEDVEPVEEEEKEGEELDGGVFPEGGGKGADAGGQDPEDQEGDGDEGKGLHGEGVAGVSAE